MTAIGPAVPPSSNRHTLTVVTWIAQAIIALLLAFGASLVATRIVAVLLIGAALGVLAASAVGLVVWSEDHERQVPPGGTA